MPARDRDRGAAGFISALEQLENHGARVSVGVHADDGAEMHRGSRSDQTVGEVALANEMTIRRVRGSRRTQGAYLRKSVAQLKRQLAGELRDAGAEVLQGATVRYAFAKPGRTLLERMQQLVPKDTMQLHDTLRVRVRGEAV